MATDGVKIIDSDLAHDTYTTLIAKYEEGCDLETVKKELLEGKEYLDEFDYEILITSYALALWEIGHLDKETENEVKKVINNGACVKRWEEWETSLGRKRRKILETFLRKIATPKKNPRKVKKFKAIQNVFFEEGDVVTFKIDSKYHVAIISQVTKIRNYCIYTFGITDFQNEAIPSLNDSTECNLLVNKIGCWENEETIRTRQPGIKEFFGSLKHDDEVSAIFLSV